MGTKTSARRRRVRSICGSSRISLIPLASGSFLSLNKASKDVTNGLNQSIMRIEVSPCVNQRVVHAFKIFKGGRFSASWAFSKTACFIEL